MIKVVVDTNVLLSSFFGGNPRRVVNLWKTGDITLCLSKPIIDEYVEVLRRLGLQGEHELEELLGLFARGFNSIFTVKTPELFVVNGDPDDNKFIECAVALNADYIVSGDNDLVAVEEYMGIKIVSPKNLLAAYNEFER